MTQVDITSSRLQADADWQTLRPITIFVTEEQHAEFVRLCGRDARYLPRLAATLASPSDIDGKRVGDNPTPG